MKCLMAEVNFSEGRDQGLIDQVRDAMLAGDPIDLMEISSDGDHNRTVFTFKGEPAPFWRPLSACPPRPWS